MRHKYVAGLAISGTLILVGALIVVSRSAVEPGGSLNGLNINGVIQGTNPSTYIPNTPQPVRPSGVDVPYTKVISDTPAQAQTQPSPQKDFFDWDSFVTALSHKSSSQTSAQNNTSISDAYSFIPTGLMSPAQMQPLSTLSPSQKELYAWGTDAGGVVLAYESLHPDQPAILTNFMQDREDASKIAAMKQLGADLQAVGDSLETLDSAPPQMSAASLGLAAAYREIGRNLAAIPDNKADDALVKAILIYDKSAEAFVQKFVAVVLIFQANEVRFTQNEPGGVFMFPAN